MAQSQQKSDEKPFTFEDETLNCVECGTEFTFTKGEQEFYAKKNFTNRPKRCAPCRERREQKKGQRTDQPRR